MIEATVTKKSKNPKAPKLFPDELIDRLFAQVQGKDAESIVANRVWPASSRSGWPSACSRPS